MKTLKGNHIYLRALEPEDINTLYEIENDEELWSLGDTYTPLSKYILKQYIANSHKDIYETSQLRFVICSNSDDTFLGMVDIFDFDAHHSRAGIGILIANPLSRHKGYGLESLEAVKKYCSSHLNLHQLYANIEETNTASINTFDKAGFKCVGLKRDWSRVQAVNGTTRYINEYLYQLIF